MIGIVQNIITNPTIFNLASNTAYQVALKTGAQAIGQPTFVVVNNKIDKKTKAYSATKEVLYQLLCLGINFAIVVPLFQKNAFRIAKKFYKNEPVFKVFKGTKDFKAYSELEKIEDKAQQLKTLGTNFKPEDINEKFGRGMTNLISIVGSVLGLAIMAPLLSKPIVTPVLKLLGLNNGEEDNKKTIDKVA